MYEEISLERHRSLLKMISYLDRKKKYKHNQERIMEGMITIDWLSDSGEIVYPIIFTTPTSAFSIEDIKYIPYKCQLNNYK